MNKMRKFATVLAALATVIIGSINSPVAADERPLIDAVDDIVPNADALSNLDVNLLPNLNISPSVLCLPSAKNTNSVKGNNNQTTSNQVINCTQSVQQTSPTPPNGGTEFVIVSEDVQCGPNPSRCTGVADCPTGTTVVGGGFNVDQGALGLDAPILSSEPGANGTSWTVTIDNGATQVDNWVIYAVCGTTP